MLNSTNKFLNQVTKFGAMLTIIVLVSACSSKEIVNESNFDAPVDYVDQTQEQGIYVDNNEVLATTELHSEANHLEKSLGKKAHNKVAQKKVRKALRLQAKVKSITQRHESVRSHQILEKNQSSESAVIGSIEDINQVLPPPPPIAATTATVVAVWGFGNWPYFLLGLLGIGLGTLGYKVISARGKVRRKSKRRLIFN